MQPSKSPCVLRGNKSKYDYIWKLDNFSSYKPGPGKSILSDRFYPGGNCQWYLELYPQSASDERYCSIYLHQTSKCEVLVECVFGFLDKWDERILSSETLKTMFPVPDNTKSCGFPNFCHLETEFGYIRVSRSISDKRKRQVSNDDKLRIICSLTFYEDFLPDNNVSPTNILGLEEVCSDLSRLYASGTCSDVVLVAGDRSFPAHKSVLIARSSVFAAMFRTDMQEKQSGRVVIADIDPVVIEGLLLYIYSGQVPALNKSTAQSVFKAADKYDLIGLKQICSDFLFSNLNSQTVFDTLLFADTINDEDLRNKVKNYLMANAEEFIKSDNWKRLNEIRPELVDEVLLAFANPPKKLKTDGN